MSCSCMSEEVGYHVSRFEIYGTEIRAVLHNRINFPVLKHKTHKLRDSVIAYMEFDPVVFAGSEQYPVARKARAKNLRQKLRRRAEA